MYKHLLAFLASVALLLGLHVYLDHEKIAELWLAHRFEVDRHLATGETLHYVVLLVLGLPAAVLLCNACPPGLWTRVRRLVERGGVWLPALVASAVAFSLSRWVTHGAWFTDDEQAYLFQVKTYLDLKLTVPALQPEASFHHPFIVVSKTVDGVQHWSGVYPVLQPALMTLGTLLGSPLLTQWLCAGLISFHTGRLAERLSGERRHGILAAWLCTTSPMLVGLASTYHTAILGTLLSLLGVRAMLAANETPGFGRGALAGACAGAAFLTRGLEGTLLVLVLGGALLWRARSEFRACLPMLAGYAVSGLVALTAYLLFNHGITGEWLESGYSVWSARQGRIMGFHSGMMWGRNHTPEGGISQTITTLIRMNTWMFGWSVSLLLPLLALLKPFRTKAAVYLVAFSGVQLFGYVFLAFGSVHDFGSAYHVWHVPWMACLMALLVSKLSNLPLPAIPAGRFVAGLILVGLVGFWPFQLRKWNTTADVILGPKKAAEKATRGEPSVVIFQGVKPRGSYSWVHHAPASFPGDPIYWMRDSPNAEAIARATHPDRAVYRLHYEGPEIRVRRVGKR